VRQPKKITQQIDGRNTDETPNNPAPGAHVRTQYKRTISLAVLISDQSPNTHNIFIFGVSQSVKEKQSSMN